MVVELTTVIGLVSQCAPSVAPKTMAAIVQVESGFDPYAINVNDGARLERRPNSKQEAAATASALLAAGGNIDMGLGQINSRNLDWLGLSIENAFEPCANLRAAGKVLETGFRASQAKGNQGQGALQMALSAYNTGNHSRGFENGYVQKVLDAGARLVPAIESVELTDTANAIDAAEQAPQAIGSPVSEPPALDIFRSADAKRVNLFE